MPRRDNMNSRTINSHNQRSKDLEEPEELSPRSAYVAKRERAEQAILQLVIRLNFMQIQKMEASFRENPSGRVNLTQFVRIAWEAMPQHTFSNGSLSQDDELKSKLVDLFREVDVDGDGLIEWNDFIRFVVEKSTLFNQQDELQSIAPYEHIQQQNESQHRHRNMIDRIVPIPDQSLVAVTEQHSNVVQIYNARSGSWYASFKTKAVPLSLVYIEPQQSLLVACSDKTMTSQHISWDHVASIYRFKERARWPTPDTLMCMCWADSQQRVYSGNATGTIHSWQLSDRPANFMSPATSGGHAGPTKATAKQGGIVERPEVKFALEGHKDIVMDLLHMHALENIASASLDTTVRVWDTYTKEQTALLKDGHTKGVNALTYNPEHRFLISAGFDHDAFVWSPFMSNLLYRLKGHRAALVGCHAIQDTHELITADCQGFLKLWDLRTFNCIHTFTTQQDTPGNDMKGFQAFTHLKLPAASKRTIAGGLSSDASGNIKTIIHRRRARATATDASVGLMLPEVEDSRIIAATKKLIFFDQKRFRKDATTDVAPIRLVLLNEVSLTILVVVERTIKTWDAIKGTLKRTFSNVSRYELTAICLDNGRRKFFVGDMNGRVACHNLQNGALLKRCASNFSTAVATMCYVSSAKHVVAASSSGAINVYDDTNFESCGIFRHWEDAHRSELRLMAHTFSMPLAATAGEDPSEGVRLWDTETAKCESILKMPGDHAALCLGFVEELVLYVCTSDGYVSFWHVRNGDCLGSFANRPPDGSHYEYSDAPTFSMRPILRPPVAEAPAPAFDSLPEGVRAEPTPASAAAWENKSRLLVLGDDFGNLRSYDVRIANSKLQSPLAAFRWSVEYAHDEAVLALATAADPRCVLSAGLDRCVRLWATDSGAFRGILLHGLEPGANNPYWSLDVDVEARQAAEYAETERKKHLIAAENEEEKATADQQYAHDERFEKADACKRTDQPFEDGLRSRVRSALVESKYPTATGCQQPFNSSSRSRGSLRQFLPRSPAGTNSFVCPSTTVHESGTTSRRLPRPLSTTRTVIHTSKSQPTLSVIPPLPSLDRLSTDAQKSLDRLLATIHHDS